MTSGWKRWLLWPTSTREETEAVHAVLEVGSAPAMSQDQCDGHDFGVSATRDPPAGSDDLPEEIVDVQFIEKNTEQSRRPGHSGRVFGNCLQRKQACLRPAHDSRVRNRT
jgi:hypothetical protein